MTSHATARREPATAAADDLLQIVVGGMTCAACAARIERQLNNLDGVTATVSYATERAYVTGTGGRSPADLIGVIERAGYTAALPAGVGPGG
jgi:P-type Cu+ transporter